MNDDMTRFSCNVTRLGAGVVVVAAISASCAFAQTAPVANPAVAPARVEAPDGSPQLAKETSISNTSTGVGRSTELAISVDEERVQGRLSSAKVSVSGGKGYTVVDPAAGRVDRPASNAGKRISPPVWELLRF